MNPVVAVANSCGLFQPVQRHVHQQRTDHAALWSALLGRRERLVLDHPGFQPVLDQPPRGEPAERLE